MFSWLNKFYEMIIYTSIKDYETNYEVINC